MSVLPKPDVPAGPIRTLFDTLHDLHHRAGWPSLRSVAKAVGCSHTTVSAAFSKPQVPRWGLLELLVQHLGGDAESIRQLWYEASLAERRPTLRGSSSPANPQPHVVRSAAAEHVSAATEPAWPVTGPVHRETIAETLRVEPPSRSDLYRELVDEMTLGSTAGAVADARRLAETAGDLDLVVMGLLFQMGGLLNLNHHMACPPLLDQAGTLLRHCPAPRRIAEHQAIAAYLAYRYGALERAVAHLVCSSRALSRVTPSLETAIVWYDLADVYSYLGLAGQALVALKRAKRVAVAAGLSPLELYSPHIEVRYALSLDHRGDTSGCVRVLRRVVDESIELFDSRQSRIAWKFARPFLGYAASRLAVMGAKHPTDRFLTEPCEPEGIGADGMRSMAEICNSIVGGRPDHALDVIGSTEIIGDAVGAAELLRLRSLAYQSAGQHRKALSVERHAFHHAARDTDRLQDMLLDKIDQQVSHDLLHPPPDAYTPSALTDSLTGLPNRRRLEQAVIETVVQRCKAVLGTLTVEPYTYIAQGHGQQRADLLLQQVAGDLARALHARGVLARTDTDEFGILLPDTDLATATTVGHQLVHVLTGQGHGTPEIPLSVRLGWAEINTCTDYETAYRRARSQCYG